MAAANQVLTTYELLESTLQYLSPFALTRTMLVSRAWHNLITRSRRLHNARILAPVQKISPSGANPGALGQIPIYTTPYAPRYNKQVPYPAGHARRSHDDQHFMGHYLNFGPEMPEHDWRVNEIGNAFATTPPCQAIALRILREEYYAVVYVRTGVRMRDLLQVWEGMVRCVGEYLGRQRRARAIVTGWVFESNGKKGWDGSCGGVLCVVARRAGVQDPVR